MNIGGINIVENMDWVRFKFGKTLVAISYSYITTTSVILVLLHETEGAARGRV